MNARKSLILFGTIAAISAGVFGYSCYTKEPTEEELRAEHEGRVINQAKKLLVLAKMGDADAQWELGMMYKKGYPLFRDEYGTYLDWLRKSAKQGDKQRQWELSLLTSDLAEREQLMRLAAEHDAGYKSSLARVYEEGKLLPRSNAEALKLHTIAADMGEISSQQRLAELYAQTNPNESIRWYKLVISKAFVSEGFIFQRDLLTKIGSVYKEQGQLVEAYAWFNLACTYEHEIGARSYNYSNSLEENLRADLEKRLTPTGIEHAQRRSREILAELNKLKAKK